MSDKMAELAWELSTTKDKVKWFNGLNDEDKDIAIKLMSIVIHPAVLAAFISVYVDTDELNSEKEVERYLKSIKYMGNNELLFLLRATEGLLLSKFLDNISKGD